MEDKVMFKDVNSLISNEDAQELMKFSDIASFIYGDYLEIGSYEGGSALRILQHMPENKTLFCMDWYDNRYRTFCENLIKYDKMHLVKMIRGNWKSKLDYFNQYQKFAFVFIDNDHTFSCTALSFLYFWNMLSANGYMLFHDYANPAYPGVMKFLSICIDHIKCKIIPSGRSGVFVLKKEDDYTDDFLIIIKKILEDTKNADIKFMSNLKTNNIIR